MDWIYTQNHPFHHIYVVHRSQAHKLNDWLDTFSHQLTNAYVECNQITVLGDFNIVLLKDDNKSLSWLKTG